MKLQIALVFMFFVYRKKWTHVFFDIFGLRAISKPKKGGKVLFLAAS
jgi:hypothetical protein